MAGALIAGALLASCSSGPGPAGVLTNADIPAVLQLKENTSATAQGLATVFNKTYPGCIGHYAVFTLHGRVPTPVLRGTPIYPQVFSESATCASSDKARSIFDGIVKKVVRFGGTRMSGIGNAALLVSSGTASATGKSYVIFWRDGPLLASVQLSGPIADTKISVAETELLSRRQIVRARA